MAKIKYKPFSIITLRRMIFNMKEHCEHVSNNKFFGCHTCPYHVVYDNSAIDCFFNYARGQKPKDWFINQMGTCVPKKDIFKKIEELLIQNHQTKAALFDTIGISKSDFESKVLNNKLPEEILSKTAQFLGTTVDYLLEK